MGSAAAVLIRHRERVLLLRRGNAAPWMPGRWNFPGGNSEVGESPIETAIRETQEETRYLVRGLRLCLSFQYSVNKSDIVHFFQTSWFEGEFVRCWENDEHSWCTKEEAAARDLVPGIRDAFLALDLWKMSTSIDQFRHHW